jgi:glucans biosynthesis protein C
MIILVVSMHAAVTYSGVGRWYYTEKVQLSELVLFLFVTYQAYLQAFFMAFLFFIAGFFVPQSYDRKARRYSSAGAPTGLAYQYCSICSCSVRSRSIL